MNIQVDPVYGRGHSINRALVVARVSVALVSVVGTGDHVADVFLAGL